MNVNMKLKLLPAQLNTTSGTGQILFLGFWLKGLTFFALHEQCCQERVPKLATLFIEL